MIQVRHNIFETNSSSTHSLVIISKEDWKKFKNNKLILNLYTGEISEVKDTEPKRRDDGKWELDGNIYDSIFDIDHDDFEWYDKSQMYYDPMCEIGCEIIHKDIDDEKMAVSIYMFEG